MTDRTRFALLARAALSLLLALPAAAQVPPPPAPEPARAPAPEPAPVPAPPPPEPSATPVVVEEAAPRPSRRSETPPAPKPPPARQSELRQRIEAALDAGSQLNKKVQGLEKIKKLDAAQSRAFQSQIASWLKLLGSLGDKAERLERGKAAGAGVSAELLRDTEALLEDEVGVAEEGLKAAAEQIAEAEGASGWKLVGTILRARCGTAVCFDNGDQKDWLGIEPLVELPVGKSVSLSNSSLASYVDNHELRIDLAAGARVWFFRDLISVSVYISKPLTDGGIRLEGSPFVYPGASIRRPYPGIGVGLLFDSLWLGFDRDELRNGDGQDTNALNPAFPPNKVISSTWTLTVALQPVTAFRTAIGTAVQATKGGNR